MLLLGFARFCMTSLCYSSSLAPSGDSQAPCGGDVFLVSFFLILGPLCLIFVIQDSGTESSKGGTPVVCAMALFPFSSQVGIDGCSHPGPILGDTDGAGPLYRTASHQESSH